MLTKAVEKEVIDRHMQSLGMEYRSGRSEITPEYNGAEDGTHGGDGGDERGNLEELVDGRHDFRGPQVKPMPLTIRPGSGAATLFQDVAQLEPGTFYPTNPEYAHRGEVSTDRLP